jgi:hypothetical protein
MRHWQVANGTSSCVTLLFECDGTSRLLFGCFVGSIETPLKTPAKKKNVTAQGIVVVHQY